MLLKSLVLGVIGAIALGAATASSDFSKLRAGSFTVSGEDGDKSIKNLALNFDGKLNTFSKFNDLSKASISIVFKQPLRIERLGLIQYGWNNWAHPETLEVTVNNHDPRLIKLQKQPGNRNKESIGTVQSIPIHTDVKTLSIKVKSIYMLGRGVRWGSIGEIGIALSPPTPAVAETADQKMTLRDWPAVETTISGSSGDGKAPKNLAGALSQKGGDALFSRFAGSRVEVDFGKVRKLGWIGLKQGKWANWAKVRDLEIKIDAGRPKVFRFADNNALQAIPVNTEGRRLVLTVKNVYSGNGTMPWGGFAMIGEVEFLPITHNMASAPFNMNATELEMTIDVLHPVKVPLSIIIGKKLHYDGPTLDLKPDKKIYRVAFSEFKARGHYGLSWKPCHINALVFDLGLHDAAGGFSLESVRGIVPDGSPSDPWYKLDKFSPPAKVIDGRKWTEGMSYSSCGRFGNSTYNGLLDAVVGDLWFHAYTGGAKNHLRRQKFDVYVDGVQASGTDIDSAKPWSINGINHSRSDKIANSWTHMKRTMHLGKEAELTWIVSSLTPGFIMRSNRRQVIASRGGGNIPKRSGAPDEDENRFFQDAARTNGTAKIGPAMVITPDQVITGPGKVVMEHLSVPWIVAVWGGLKQPTFWGDKAVGVLLTLDKGAVEWDASGISLPQGETGISTSFHGKFGENWKLNDVRRHASLLAGMLRNYPLQCREWYYVDKDEVRIRDEFTYYRWGKPQYRASDYAPIPPIFAWGKISRNWGKINFDLKRKIDTPSGPYCWNSGSVLEYRLPRPLNRHAAFPYLTEGDMFSKRLSRKIMAQPEPRADKRYYIGDAWQTAIRPLYCGAAVLGASWLEPDARKRILNTLKWTVDNAFSAVCWYQRRELFSGQTYLASLWLDPKVSPVMFGDINSGVGASCYALYCYAKYTGDWKKAEKLMPRVRDVVRFAEVVNDWALPMTSAREGILFSGIDMDTIGFIGISAAEKIAEQAGTREDVARFAYLRSKIAPVVAFRLNFQRYLDPTGKYPQLWVNGFSESGPNLETANYKSGVGLDHIAMMFCWEGEQPEMYQFLNQALGEDGMADLQHSLLDKYFTGPNYAGWRKMPFNKGRSASHLAVRSWLSQWPVADTNKDFEIWTKWYSAGLSRPDHNGFYGVFNNRRDRVYLFDWEPAELGLLKYNPRQRQLTAELACQDGFELAGVGPKAILRVVVDGKELATDRINYANGIFRIKMPACKSDAVITFEP